MVDVAAVKPHSRETAVDAFHEHGPMLLARTSFK